MIASHLLIRPLRPTSFRQSSTQTALPGFIQPFFQYASDSFITQGIQTGIEVLHSSGTPWVASFVISGVALRLLTAPAHVYAEKLFARRLHATNYLKTAILQKASERYKIPLIANPKTNELHLGDPALNNRSQKMIDETLSKYWYEQKLQASRIQNLKMFTVPIWVFSSFAIRNILNRDFAPALGSFLWIPNFLEPDPFFILPVTVGIFGFLNLYSQRFVFPSKMSPVKARIYDVVLASMTLGAVAVMLKLPACIPLYWLTVSITGMAQSLLLRHPRIKKFFGIHRLPWDSQTPLRDLLFLRRRQISST
ncbi:hypothetical protein M3Y94_00937400 [Aphelenchoides besseyi]|nr:hypothetical protein M3Y94_00937400 [Aphelenchoides besseyi]KAI6224935.1 hypothetical protein M3Y95_00804900 [Aphelenchoides besseyi]